MYKEYKWINQLQLCKYILVPHYIISISEQVKHWQSILLELYYIILVINYYYWRNEVPNNNSMVVCPNNSCKFYYVIDQGSVVGNGTSISRGEKTRK